jgi:sterol desaturase/sphingolipid hydroxylase (fatty acid hydroxylase superfamily)
MDASPLFRSLTIFGAHAVLLLGLALATMPMAAVVLWMLAGLLGFTLVEYLVHRNVFHLAPRTERARRFQYAIHGNHHEDPSARTNVMMRPAYALVALGVITACLAPFGRPMLAFAPGFVVGYGAYLFVHFAVHAWRPPSGVLRGLWRHHHLHHFADDTRNYGVSSPLWDVVFGTLARRRRP